MYFSIAPLTANICSDIIYAIIIQTNQRKQGMMARRKSGLNPRHKKILTFLESYQLEKGYPPSIREICDYTEISSTSVVNYYLNQLAEMGYIERSSNVSRGINLIKKTKALLNSLAIKYSYVDVDLLTDDEEQSIEEELSQWTDQLAFPALILNNERIIVGYREQEIRKTLESMGA